jgi:hypothetical protein
VTRERRRADATEHMLRCGMDIAVVETGGDPGHVPAGGIRRCWLHAALDGPVFPNARVTSRPLA